MTVPKIVCTIMKVGVLVQKLSFITSSLGLSVIHRNTVIRSWTTSHSTKKMKTTYKVQNNFLIISTEPPQLYLFRSLFCHYNSPTATFCRSWWPQAVAQLSARPSSSSHVPNGGADYITSEQRRDILELTGQFTARPYVAYQNCTHDGRLTKVRQSYCTHVSCMSP